MTSGTNTPPPVWGGVSGPPVAPAFEATPASDAGQPPYQAPPYGVPTHGAPTHQAPTYPGPTDQPAYPAPAAPVVPYGGPAMAPMSPYGAPGMAPMMGTLGGARGLQMKARNPVGVWLGLPLVTFGVYHLVWYYKIHREMSEFDRRRSISPAGPLLVIMFLGITVVAPLISYYNTGNRIANAQRAAGMPASCSGGVGLLLMFVFGLGTLYYQGELNKIVASYGVGTPAGTDVALRA